MLANGKLDLIR